MQKFLLFSIAGIVLISILPVFIFNYYNVTLGAYQEAEMSIEKLNLEAANAGVTAEVFIQKHLDSGDSIFVASGKIFRKSWNRYATYKKILLSINPNFDQDQTGLITSIDNIKGFVSTYNSEIAAVTYQNYKLTLVFDSLTQQLILYYEVILAALLFFFSNRNK